MRDCYGIKCEIIRRFGIMVEVIYRDGSVKVFHHTKVFE